MSEFEEKLGQILGDPQAMGQIMSLAQSLGLESASPSQSAPDKQRNDFQEQTLPFLPEGVGDLGDLLGQVDPSMIAVVMQLLGRYQSNDDQRVALLHALRPFVREERYAKLDKAIQIAKLSRLIRMALELFRRKEDADV